MRYLIPIFGKHDKIVLTNTNASVESAAFQLVPLNRVL